MNRPALNRLALNRPALSVLLCCVAVVSTFSATGHLRIGESDRPTRIKVQGKAPRPEPTERVFGSVLDSMGYFLAGAQVTNGAPGAARQSQRTDGQGRFELDLPESAVTQLRFGHLGHRLQWARAIPAAREPMIVALEPWAPWDPAPDHLEPVGADLFAEGLVQTEHGDDLPGAFVVVAETGVMTRVDEASRFRVPLPGSGAVTLLVHHPEGVGGRGFFGRAEPFDPGRREGRVPAPDLIAYEAVSVRGTVRGADGNPLRGVPIQIVAGELLRTIVTGEGGAFRLGGLPAAPCQLRTFAFRGEFCDTVELDLRAEVTPYDVRMRRAGDRRLRVVTDNGEPVPRAVVATSFSGRRRGVARTDADGWVQVPADGDTRYEVRYGEDGRYRELRVLSLPPEGTGELVVEQL